MKSFSLFLVFTLFFLVSSSLSAEEKDPSKKVEAFYSLCLKNSNFCSPEALYKNHKRFFSQRLIEYFKRDDQNRKKQNSSKTLLDIFPHTGQKTGDFLSYKITQVRNLGKISQVSVILNTEGEAQKIYPLVVELIQEKGKWKISNFIYQNLNPPTQLLHLFEEHIKP